MTSAVFGKDLKLYCKVGDDYFAIGCAENIGFHFENELIGKTDVNAGLFRKKRVRISSWTASITGLVTLVNTTLSLSIFHFLQEAIRRTELTLRFIFTDEAGASQQVDGVALISTCDLTGQQQDFAEFDLEFEGTGSVDIGSISSPPDITCEVENTIWTTLADGSTTIINSLLIPGVGQTITILGVSRSGVDFYETSGTVGNLQFKYTSGTGTIAFRDAGNPAAPDLEPVSINYKIETA